MFRHTKPFIQILLILVHKLSFSLELVIEVLLTTGKDVPTFFVSGCTSANLAVARSVGIDSEVVVKCPLEMSWHMH
jgi:hypothetical protein